MNRKERGAAAQSKRKDADQDLPTLNASTIPMAQPDRSGPKSKTLFELADERQNLLDKGRPFPKNQRNGHVTDDTETDDNLDQDSEVSSPLGPFGDAIFFTLTLGMLHFTLDVLVYNQYRQEIEWSPIIARTLTLLPVLFLVIYMLRMDAVAKFPVARQVFFLLTAVVAGCHMIYVGNEYDYYAVLKRAPPIGTLWIWSVIEMRLPYAVVSLLVDGGYCLWNGYSVY